MRQTLGDAEIENPYVAMAKARDQETTEDERMFIRRFGFD